MLTRPKLMLPRQIGRAPDRALFFFCFGRFVALRRAMKLARYSVFYATGLRFLVMHGCFVRGFTLMVRSRGA